MEVVKERTLSIIKPDGVERGLVGEVIGRLERAGFKIVAMKMVRLSKDQAERFYAVHRERPFFRGLTEFMVSGPAVVMALEADNVISRYREMIGATEPTQAAEGTIRRLFATDGRRNVVHGSDGPDSAAFEIGFFFSRMELGQD
jgi:nucleoside-diphosphate kinase